MTQNDVYILSVISFAVEVLIAAKKAASEISEEFSVKSVGYMANVLDKASLEQVREKILEEVGEIDILINGAGGNAPTATTKVEELT